MRNTAEIITIGDEILYGQTLDTNSHWMSDELDAAGIKVIRKTTIGDQKETILNALKEAEQRAEIILITGGLGPTSDDLTKPCLAEYFGVGLVRHPNIVQHISRLFEKIGRKMTELNEMQADLPENCVPVQNNLGTAPGMWFEERGKVFVSMPGVPYEMKRMMKESIIPGLKDKFVEGAIVHRMVRTIAVPESKLAKMIEPWEKSLPASIKLAYLPTMGTVKLRLTSSGDDEKVIRTQIDRQIADVLPLIEPHVYGFDNEEIEEAIGRILKGNGKKLAVAESCTGGHIAHKITSVPGSSQWFEGGFIPYSNTIKENLLKVPREMLIEHGAVSEPVVRAMAENTRLAFDADIAISVSGIAGPSGGTPEKPVGTVWVGYADKDKTLAKKFQFTKDRMLNIQFTTMVAFNMIRINSGLK